MTVDVKSFWQLYMPSHTCCRPLARFLQPHALIEYSLERALSRKFSLMLDGWSPVANYLPVYRIAFS